MMIFNGVLGPKPPRVLRLPERGTPGVVKIDPKDSNICEGSLLFLCHPPAAMSLAIDARVLDRNEPGSESRGEGASPEFLSLLTSHQSTLYAFLSALLGRAEGVQDVLQETNLALFAKAAEYDVQRPFLPWAMRFARFQAMAWRKRQSRDRLVLDDGLFDVFADRLTQDAVVSNRRLDALEACMEKLPEAARDLVDARYLRSASVQEIARNLGRSVNVVSVCLFRIRKTLFDCVSASLAGEGEA
jgi:RNA polymerase sigma-70 factor (ECF subfamily)